MAHEVKGNYLRCSLEKGKNKFKQLKGINDQMKEFCLIRILKEITESGVDERGKEGKRADERRKEGKRKSNKETMNENFP